MTKDWYDKVKPLREAGMTFQAISDKLRISPEYARYVLMVFDDPEKYAEKLKLARDNRKRRYKDDPKYRLRELARQKEYQRDQKELYK